MRHSLLTPTFVALIACTGQPALRAQTPATPASAAPLPSIACQGRLLQSGAAANGTFAFVFSILDGTGTEQWNSGTQTLSITVVPEVSTWAMMLVGLAGLGLAGYRRAESGRTILAD